MILSSCKNQSKDIKSFRAITLGGANIHGDLFKKKYTKPNDSSIRYKKWKGYEVSSNDDIENLLRSNPECKAIRIMYRNGDTLNNFELTKEIGEFHHLQFLEIHSNRITKYPKEIEKLTELEEIVFQVGKKEEIELDFSKFLKLKHLTIHFADDIKKFPNSIFKSTNLETLKLFRFFLQEGNVLNGIENLSKLKELYLWDSNLILPENAEYKFDILETLIIDRMRAPLPDYFYQSNSIRTLGLISMFDTLNLDEISKMKNLECVSLSYQNKFLGELSLPKLEHLNITDFRGDEIKTKFKNLPALSSLIIWGCLNLTRVSKIEGGNLRSIVIANNPKLKTLNFNSKKLENLEEVIIRSNESLENKPSKINDIFVRRTSKW